MQGNPPATGRNVFFIIVVTPGNLNGLDHFALLAAPVVTVVAAD
jgi:hypothetical protein